MKKLILILVIMLNIITPVFSELTIVSNPKIEYDFINYDGSWQELIEELNNTIDLNKELPKAWQMTQGLILLAADEPYEKVVWNFQKQYTDVNNIAALIINADTYHEFLIEGEINHNNNLVTFDFTQLEPGINYMLIFEKVWYLNMEIIF